MDSAPHSRNSADNKRSTWDVNRRVFIKRLAGGIAIGLPAIGALMGQKPAQVKAVPNACSGSCPNPACNKVYEKYMGHGCGGYGVGQISTCSGQIGEECVGLYYLYSATVTGFFCGSFTDGEGGCA